MYHLTITQFGNMKDFHSDNLTFYSHYYIPSISNILLFLSTIPEEINQTKKWLLEIKEENIKSNDYLNSINHHILITPFISYYNLIPDIKKIINEFDSMDNLWIDDINNFNYRNIDIKNFFKLWNDAIIRTNLNSKTNKINEEIITLNPKFI